MPLSVLCHIKITHDISAAIESLAHYGMILRHVSAAISPFPLLWILKIPLVTIVNRVFARLVKVSAITHRLGVFSA